MLYIVANYPRAQLTRAVVLKCNSTSESPGGHADVPHPEFLIQSVSNEAQEFGGNIVERIEQQCRHWEPLALLFSIVTLDKSLNLVAK